MTARPPAWLLVLPLLAANLASAQGPRIMINVEKPVLAVAGAVSGPGHVQAPAGTSPGAALIGSVVGVLLVRGMNESRERAASDFVAGVEKALSQVDLRRELADALRAELARSTAFKHAVLEQVEDPSELEQPGLLERIGEQEIFTVDARCLLEGQVIRLQVAADVRLWRKNGVTPIYSTQLRYGSRDFASEEQARTELLADGGALLARLAREGMAEVARLFVADAQSRAAAPLLR